MSYKVTGLSHSTVQESPPLNIVLRIFRMTLSHKLHLSAAYLSVIGAATVYLLLPKAIGYSIDEIVELADSGQPILGTVLIFVLLILGLSLVRGIFAFLQTHVGENLSQVVAYELRNRFYDHLQNLSFGFHDRQHTGNLMSRAISDVESVRMFVNTGIIRTPYFAILFVVVSTILLTLDWRLGLASMSFLPPAAFQSSLLRMRMRKIWLAAHEKTAELSTTLQENFTGVKVVKAFVSENYEQSKFEIHNKGVAEDSIEAEKLHAINSSFTGFVFLISLGLILWLGGRAVINGDMSIGELAQFVLYMQILAMPVKMTAQLVHAYARATSAGQRLFEILDYESPVRQSMGARNVGRVDGSVEFQNVHFRYNDTASVINGIDLEVPPGQVTAILGAPGSGKSTLVDLIPRFYDVTEGAIRIDGINVQDITLESLRKNIGLVQQDSFLFSTTIRENIAYGRPDSSMEQIISAAKLAQLHDFIESMPEGYDSPVGERGTTLSGGQRQRMAIARAILLDPPILILDDSTSSVDAATEEKITKAMEVVMRDRTTFVIANRIATIQRADTIVVIDKGEIVQQGTHSQLMANSGPYREIYELQLRPQEEVMREIDMGAVGTVGAAQ